MKRALKLILQIRIPTTTLTGGGIELVIKTAKGKNYPIVVTSFNEEKAFYNSKYGEGSQIRIEHIKGIQCKNSEDEKKVRYEILNKKYGQINLEKIIQNFKDYYLEILELDQKKIEKKLGKNSIEYEISEFKKEIYNDIFKDITSDLDNLLFSYFSGTIEQVNEESQIDAQEDIVLLLQQSNQSQKQAIKTVLNDKISIIEGPPGTGKTTTIINIIANLLYRNQKVLIVSKNNSAINNVVEELDEMNLPNCYIRLGNYDVMKELGNNIKEKVKGYSTQIRELKEKECDNEKEKLKQVIIDIGIKEEKLNKLIKQKNQLNELENQLRHAIKKSEAYEISEYEETLKRPYHRMQNTHRIKSKIEHLAKILVKISEKEKIYVFEKVLTYFKLNYSTKYLEEDGMKLHFALEEKYLRNLIELKNKALENEDIAGLRDEVEKLYKQEYIAFSHEITRQSILSSSNEELLEQLILKIDEKEKELVDLKDEDRASARMRNVKNDAINLYPIIMTTVDGVLGNLYTYFKKGIKIDYVIIDEASQCDILSALPLLYIAEKIVVVGDCKQLSAIIDTQQLEIKNKVPKEYDYIEETFLSTISKVIKPKPNMLLEHYRCDYNIINYCNKYFYDNKLIIYKDAKEDAMSIINVDKGKYVELEENEFINYREIKTLEEIIQGDIKNKFVITPFRKQADCLREKYNKEQCGTIHTFQGKGDDQVYFSTVLNDDERANQHLQGEKNLFSQALINVAVSRAKKKFVLVTDKKFLKNSSKNMKNLIEYIEIYGEEIPDKTVCIFDYLYKQMHSYQITDNCSNIFEKTLRDYLIKYTKKIGKYHIQIHFPLASLITDKKFLDKNPEVRRFVLNEKTHVDFVIYSEEISKPSLVIELDGETHATPIQQERDRKKNYALDHMEIPLWRIKSKAVLTEEEFYAKLSTYLDK